MNKNIIKLIAIVVMIFMLGAVLVACKGADGADGAQGPKGDKGDKGDTGAAGQNGQDGKDGKDGETPTVEISADGYWVINGVKTTVKAEGKDGVDGTNGTNGTNGKDGVDATDCANHVWESYVLDTHTIDHKGTILNVCVNCGDAAFEYDVHSFGADSAWEIVDNDGDLAVVIGCDGDCGLEITVDIPDDLNSRFYMFQPGTCVDEDKYHFSIFDAEYALSETETASVDVACYVEVENFGAYDHVPAVAFDPANIDESWKLARENEDVCDCIEDKVYVTECTLCGEEGLKGCQATVATEAHVWGDIKPARYDANTGVSYCEWVPFNVQECTACSLAVTCEDCIKHHEIEGATAIGHDWTEWSVSVTPTLDSEGTLIRTCQNEGCQYGVTAYSLGIPALSKGAYYFSVDEEMLCTEDGKYTFTWVCPMNDCACGETAQEIDFTIAYTHEYSERTEYTVTYDETTGLYTAHIKCDSCPYTVDVVLPEVYTEIEGVNNLNRPYLLVSAGHCFQKYDVVSIAISGVDVDGLNDDATIVVVFNANNNYSHDEIPAKELCTKVEGTDKYYWVYKCTKCGEWVVAYAEDKDASVTPV